jgi:hypothetical protein
MEVKLKLSRDNDSPSVDATLYRSLIGSLRYLLHTWPELTYSVCYLGHFMELPRSEHLEAVKRVLQYVAAALDYGLLYTRGRSENFKILGYSDSDMVGDIDDCRSTSGVLFFLGDGAATWTSQKQRVVARSSCKAEYITGTTVACQAVWLAWLLEEIMGTQTVTPQVMMDNMQAIALSKNPVLHGRSKHIKTKYHFTRECVDRDEVELESVGTADQLADIPTKPLARVCFQKLCGRISVIKLIGN